MSIFEWHGADLEDLTRGWLSAHGSGDVATARITLDMFRAAIKPDEEDEARLARSRWLEQNRAEYSFPCGVVPQAEPAPNEPRLNVVPTTRRPIASVIAAVLPIDLVFLRDGNDDIVEVGRIPRTAIVSVDVVDRSDAHIPEPIHETIEPPQLVLLLLTWTNEGLEDEDRFAFQSPWLAWRAGRRLMGARRS